MNVGKSEVMKCSMYLKIDRVNISRDGEPLEEVDRCKSRETHVAADAGC